MPPAPFVSEWYQAYPHLWRAESALAYAAIAAFQGWGGATIHTYRYSTWEPEARLGGGASTINGVVYRNYFDAFNDPAKFGLFYHEVLSDTGELWRSWARRIGWIDTPRTNRSPNPSPCS